MISAMMLSCNGMYEVVNSLCYKLTRERKTPKPITVFFNNKSTFVLHGGIYLCSISFVVPQPSGNTAIAILSSILPCYFTVSDICMRHCGVLSAVNNILSILHIHHLLYPHPDVANLYCSM